MNAEDDAIQREETVRAIAEYARFESPDAAGGFVDEFSSIVDTADVIGIGERSHGISDCSRIRRQFVRRLVEHHGIRVIACEANFAAVARLNEYIQSGDGPVEDHLDSAGIHPHWKNEEMAALVEWLREFNRGRDATDTVELYGLDYQSGRALADAIADYLRRVDPEFLADVEDELDYLSESRVDLKGFYWSRDAVDPDEYVETWNAVQPELASRLDEREREYVEQTSEAEYELVSRIVELIDHTATFAHNRWNMNIEALFDQRSESLAENWEWVYDRHTSDKMAVLAHNFHVRQGEIPMGPIDTMFERISGGDVSVASVGFSVGGGEFRVIDTHDNDGWKTVGIPEPPELSVPDVFSEIGSEVGIVDIEAAASEPAVEDWFEAEPRTFTLAARSDPEPVDVVAGDPRAFDAIVHVDDADPHTSLDDR